MVGTGIKGSLLLQLDIRTRPVHATSANQNFKYSFLKQNSGYQLPQKDKTPPLSMRNGA